MIEKLHDVAEQVANDKHKTRMTLQPSVKRVSELGSREPRDETRRYLSISKTVDRMTSASKHELAL